MGYCKETPYAELNAPEEVESYVRGRNILSKPNSCPDDVYSNLIKPCWETPTRRPKFYELKNIALKLKGIALELSQRDDKFSILVSRLL